MRRDVKKLFAAMVAAFILGVPFYLVLAFVYASWGPFSWPIFGRGLLGLFWIFWFLLALKELFDSPDQSSGT